MWCVFLWSIAQLSCDMLHKGVLHRCVCVKLSTKVGHTPSTAGTFRKKFRKNSGKTPETLSERFLEFLSRVRLGCPKPYNSRHLRLPERFQNSLPPSTAGDASFFRIGSGEGLSELVMEFPAVLGVFLKKGGFASSWEAANLSEKVSRNMGHRSNSIVRSRGIGPLSSLVTGGLGGHSFSIACS